LKSPTVARYHDAIAMPEPGEIRIVADGTGRLRKDYRPEVEAAIRARYAAELQRAGGLKRLLLRHRIRREIEREIEDFASRKALYLSLDLVARSRHTP